MVGNKQRPSSFYRFPTCEGSCSKSSLQVEKAMDWITAGGPKVNKPENRLRDDIWSEIGAKKQYTGSCFYTRVFLQKKSNL